MLKPQVIRVCQNLRKYALALPVVLAAGFMTNAHAQVIFQDVSTTAGFANSGTETWGAAWGDIDSDLYPDIFINNHRTRAKLYHNNRNGTFTDISKTTDLSKTAGWTGGRSDVDKHGAIWGDVDNGDADLLIAVSSNIDHILINTAGKLTDRTVQYGLDHLLDFGTRMNMFLDYNGDGLLDLANITLYPPAFHPQLPNGTFGVGAGVEQLMSCPWAIPSTRSSNAANTVGGCPATPAPTKSKTPALKTWCNDFSNRLKRD